MTTPPPASHRGPMTWRDVVIDTLLFAGIVVVDVITRPLLWYRDAWRAMDEHEAEHRRRLEWDPFYRQLVCDLQKTDQPR